jgi:hypothetical protein
MDTLKENYSVWRKLMRDKGKVVTIKMESLILTLPKVTKAKRFKKEFKYMVTDSKLFHQLLLHLTKVNLCF